MRRPYLLDTCAALWIVADEISQSVAEALTELTPSLLMESSFLPGSIRGDPADRIIAATARECGYTVVTRDRALLDYGREGYLSVLPC